MSADRSPAMVSHRDVMAIRGMPPGLRQRRMTEAADAVDRIVASHDALRSGFVVIAECELARAALELRPRRRWWRRSP
jgi:hypothetical protein